MGFTFTGHLSGARNFVSHQDLESIEKHLQQLTSSNPTAQ